MAANRLDAAKGAEEAGRGAAEKPAGAETSAGGGGKTWLPLILNILLMPAIAYGVTTFVLVPKIQGGHGAAVQSSKEDGEHGSGSNGGAKTKFTAPLGGIVLVNVAGTAGTRYLVSSMTLVGKTAEFKDSVAQN